MQKTFYVPQETMDQIDLLANGKESRSCIISALASLMTSSKERIAEVRAEAVRVRRGGKRPKNYQLYPSAPPRAIVRPATRGLPPRAA